MVIMQSFWLEWMDFEKKAHTFCCLKKTHAPTEWSTFIWIEKQSLWAIRTMFIVQSWSFDWNASTTIVMEIIFIAISIHNRWKHKNANISHTYIYLTNSLFILRIIHLSTHLFECCFFFVYVTGIYTTMYVLDIQHTLSTHRRVQKFVKVIVFLTYFNAEIWPIASNFNKNKY